MSLCSRPPKTKKTAYGAPATKTVGAPAARDESCGPSVSTVVSGGGSNSTTSTVVAGPAGPAGPMGPAGPAGADGTNGTNGWGFEWKGPFALNVQYYAQADNQLASVVSYMGSSYIAVADNISMTEENPEHEPGVSSSWQLVAEAGAGGLNAQDQTFFDSIGSIYDWVKNATLTDLIGAGVIAAGIVLAGSVIVDMFSNDGSGDGSADSRFSGSDGYVPIGYVAPDIKEVLNALCSFANIPHDTSSLPDEECMFVIGNNTSIRTIIDQLSLAYQFEMVDTAGVLKFVPRAATAVKTLTNDDIGYDKSPVPPARYLAKRFQGIDLPRSVTLNYMAEDTDYNTMTQTSQLFTFQEGQDVNLSVPVTMSHAKAKQVTEIALIQSHVERMQYKFTVNYNHLDLEPGDVIETPMGVIRISRITELEEGLLEIEGTDAGVAESVLSSDLEVAVPPASTNVPLSLGYSQGLFFDPTNLTDNDTSVRLYCAVHGYDRAGWPGAQIWVSVDGGATYAVVASTNAEATIGLVATPVPSADYHVWDNTTSITVQLKTNELVSKSELGVLNGENFCMIGNEIIGFKNAVLTGPKTYTLTGLLRGRQGTEWAVDGHVANELFVLLDSALVKLEWPDSDRNKSKKYKVVTIGSSLDKVDAQDVFMYSNNKRLWTVHGQKLEHLGSDWRFTFKERVRFNNDLQSGTEITHDSDWAGFGIAIYDSTGTNIVKTYTTQSELWTYTAAMQTTDFGSVQSSIKSKITQLSQLGAPGYPITLNS